MIRYAKLSVILVLLCCSVAMADSAWDWDSVVMSARADVNGDGKKEDIRATSLPQGKFTLTVNSAQVFGKFSSFEGAEGFYLANINRRDRFKEIVVFTSGPSDDFEHAIFLFDGKKIHRVDQFGGHLKFFGNGTVRNDLWVECFWTKTDTYRLSSRHQLIWVPKRIYQLNINATVYEKLPLRQSPRSKIIVLPAGRKAKIAYYDGRTGLYFVRSSGGSRGWVTATQIHEHLTGFPQAD